MKNLSIAADISWKIAAREAAAAKFQFIEIEHILNGICSIEKIVALGPKDSGLGPQEFSALQEEHNILSSLFSQVGIDATKTRRRMRKILGTGNFKHVEKVIHKSDSCKQLFSLAAELSVSENITTLHLLAAILQSPSDNIRQALALDEAGIDKFRDTLHAIPELKAIVKSRTPLLDKFGRDLTQAARDGKLGPFVGRRDELLQVLQTLARSMKNNPVLVGEPGVGKTAVVEALAVRAVQGKNAQVLEGKKIIELNMGALVGGTKYRGEFEERLTKIIDEARSNPEIIIFIDEIHTLVGAGGDNLDAADIMKPALARGEIKCIGATTIAEYRKYIESDPALERRFEKVTVDEPSRGEAIAILKGLKARWERHYGNITTDEAIEAAVDLSMKFDKDHFLPDKAIDLIDKAGARIQVPFLSMSPGMEGKAVNHANPAMVTAQTVAEVLSGKLGLPLEILTGHLRENKSSRFLEIASYLNKKVIGQTEAIERISQRLKMAHAGIGKRKGPLAVFLFLGPTGVGKTELAKSLAEFLFGSSSDLVRFDMSEYMEEHSVSKLIGSPPGYVGHDEEGQLTGKLRTRPYSVVLLDEVEKANPRIFDLFLQVFDDGRITDAKGRTIDAKNAIFVMTSNLYRERRLEKKIGFLEDQEESQQGEAMTPVKGFFRAEFLNRIDEQIVFKPLGKEEADLILAGICSELFTDLKDRYNVGLRITEKAKTHIIKEGFDPNYGARNLRRTIERVVQMPLSNLILSDNIANNSAWVVDCRNDEIIIVPE